MSELVVESQSETVKEQNIMNTRGLRGFQL